MTSIQSALRKKVKEGLKKLIVVRFSPTIYRITKITQVSKGKMGFPTYLIEDTQGNLVRTTSGTPKRFNSGELLKIGSNTPLTHSINLERANFLNRVRAEDLNVAEPEQEPEPEPEPLNPPVVPLPKPVSKYGSKDWTQALKGKTFNDFDNIPSQIVKVEYSRTYIEYIIDYRNTNGVFQATLGDIIELSANEPWFQPEYNQRR